MRAALALALALGTCSVVRAADDPPAGQVVTVRSPDGQVRVALRLRGTADGQAAPTYRVTYRGRVVVGDSRLGLDFAEGGPFGARVHVARVEQRAHDVAVRGILGKTSEARDHYREATVALEERAPPNRRVEVVLRAYDDGVALRYRIPAQPALAAFTITEERTQFVLDGRSQAYALRRDGFVSSYEGYYTVGPLQALPPDSFVALPLLTRHPGGAWVAVTEAALTDYAGLYLAPVAGRPGVLASRLSPWPGEPAVKVRAMAPHVSPWRVVMVADEPGRLIESSLVYLLNEPTAIPDPSWIRPGRTTFPWWNDYVVPDAGFTPGLNTATMKYYVDFCAENGVEYHSLDGYHDTAWYGGPIIPDGTPQDLTRAHRDIDLPEVLRYARERGVRLRLWMHWLPLRDQIDRAFAQYEAWGIEGVMVDFMDRDDQEMVRFYREILEKAAAHRLTVNFHGAYKPTGLRRTFPNELNREGVLNMEYNKWSAGSTPEHELVVPFTRMLAGPMDYHQGGFRHVAPEAFHQQFTAPLVMGTRARTLAMYVVYENYLPMVADYPAAYRGQLGLDFVTGVPAVWDETRVLHGEVGDVITVARRSGTAWYVGSMTDGEAREVEVPLAFLGEGSFVAEVYADDPAAAALRTEALVTAADTLRVRMAPAGGHAVRLTPAPPGAALPR